MHLERIANTRTGTRITGWSALHDRETPRPNRTLHPYLLGDTLRQLCQELDEMPGTISGRVLRSWVVKQLESRPAPPEVPGEVLHDEDKLVMTRSI